MPDAEISASSESTQFELCGTLDALKPCIVDQQLLTPIRYWGLLTEAQTILQQLSEQQETDAITNAATLLAEELLLMQNFEQRRRSLVRSGSR